MGFCLRQDIFNWVHLAETHTAKHVTSNRIDVKVVWKVRQVWHKFEWFNYLSCWEVVCLCMRFCWFKCFSSIYHHLFFISRFYISKYFVLCRAITIYGQSSFERITQMKKNASNVTRFVRVSFQCTVQPLCAFFSIRRLNSALISPTSRP